MIQYRTTIMLVGLEWEVEIFHQPPTKHADNPDDLVGYTEFEVLAVTDPMDGRKLGYGSLSPSPLVAKYLREKVDAFLKEQSNGVQAFD